MRTSIFILFFITGAHLFAQNAFTLKEAVEYAYSHQASVLNAELEQKMNKVEVLI
jgi:hypothetical protein